MSDWPQFAQAQDSVPSSVSVQSVVYSAAPTRTGPKELLLDLAPHSGAHAVAEHQRRAAGLRTRAREAFTANHCATPRKTVGR